jgi:predicted permease
MVAQWGGGVLRTMLLPDVEWANAFADPRMLLAAGAAALVCGLLTGLAPALHAGRADVTADLKAGAREGTFHRSRLRTTLLVVQGALSVVLLVGAGLFVRSLHNVRALDLGYDASHVLYVNLAMRGLQMDSTHAVALRQQLLDRARALPGVEQATLTVTVPFWMSMNNFLFTQARDSIKGDFYEHAGSPSYFATMGTRIVRGRGFTDADLPGSPRVVVVSQSMAKRLWPGKEALGQCIRVNVDTVPCTTVVGIAQDIRRESFSEDGGLQYYLPITQFNHPQGSGLFVRTRGDAQQMLETVRRELQRGMPGASYVTLTSLQSILDPNIRPWQLGATMFALFGALALLLAAVGLYSVIAYNVTQRTHEMGVRVALGAQGRDVIRLVVVEGVRVAVVGLVIGVVIALVASRFIAPLLFNVPARDPWTFGSVTVALLAVAVAASFIPAWRAARVDPSVALRAD